MRTAATKTNLKGAPSPEERREKLWQTLEDWATPPLYLLVLYVIPFVIPFATLHFLGAPWWVSVPLSWILLPFVRARLFGPPCHCCRRRRAARAEKPGRLTDPGIAKQQDLDSRRLTRR